MINDTSALFRPEVARHKSDRLQGTVTIATPLSWQSVGILFFAIVAIGLAILAAGSYARVEVATGTVALDTGVASVVPTRAGVISAVSVREGQEVAAGGPLLEIRAEETLVGGRTAPSRARQALMEQDERLSSQGVLTLAAARADRARLQAQIDGTTAELAQLARQAADQRRLIEAARIDFERARSIAGRGFVSRRDLDAREASLVSRRQQLSQLEQTIAAKRADAIGASRAMTQASAVAEAQIASTQSARAALSQEMAQVDLASGYVITAPVGGTVTALTARLGAPASPDRQLMMVIPKGARLRAELYLPTSAAAFVEAGQEVRLAVDAFPYATFGTVRARVLEVSGAPVLRTVGTTQTSSYLVTAELSREYVQAFDKRQRLLPGMALTARITTERRSLLRWLFEPLFAVRNR